MTSQTQNAVLNISRKDVLVVQKQTALERYTRRAMNIDFIQYVEHGGGSMEDLLWAHQAHVETRKLLETTLVEIGWTYEILNLDELHRLHLPFFSSKIPSPLKANSLCEVQEETPEQQVLPNQHKNVTNTFWELNPKKKLVITLGGDGTLLHASHYVGGEVAIFGINSCVEHSVGALCTATRDNLAQLLFRLKSGNLTHKKVPRLRTSTSEKPQLPLALNDILVCNQHPAATSRYKIAIERNPNTGANSHNKQLTQPICVEQAGEHQLSSGIWVSTAAGSSAAIKSYGLPKLPLTSQEFLLAIREPYISCAQHTLQSEYKLDKLVLSGDHYISLLSRMRTGLVSVDGPDHGLRLGFGSRVCIDSPEDGALLLYI